MRVGGECSANGIVGVRVPVGLLHGAEGLMVRPCLSNTMGRSTSGCGHALPRAKRRDQGGVKVRRGRGSVFFPEACSVDVSFRRVCKHAARLRAAPEVEYVSTSTSGRVRHFRRVCMPASTWEFGGGGYVLQSCSGCRGICTSVLHGLVLGFCMRVF